nr:FGGY-family carbohydrate kinase [Spiroplasma clarkii]
MGTSGVVLSVSQDNKLADGKLHIFNHAIKNLSYSMGVTLSAGYSLKWFKECFFKEQSYSDLMESVNNSTIGANGVLFTPWLFGERTPYLNAEVRANFMGLGANSTAADLTRSVIEGITFSLKIIYEMLNENKTYPKLISIGGGAKNKEWLQIQADIFGTEVYTIVIKTKKD